MNPFERRQGIWNLLCRRGCDTYENLAREFGVCERTIRYDVESLMCSYPIETMRGHNGGVRVADGFPSYYNRHNRDAKTLTPRQRSVLEKLSVSSQLDGEDRDALTGILSEFAP